MTRAFADLDKKYYEKCSEPGSLIKLKYNSKTYNEENRDIAKEVLVYLPYNYDKTEESYNVFYLMHGGGGDCNEVFGGMEAKTELKNILDNMIYYGDIKPLIVAAPSFYYEGTEEAKTIQSAAGLLTQNFHHEFVNDLIPLIEREVRAKTGREYRAFGGYSMGSEATWNIFARCLKQVKYFMPMSGDCWAIQVQGGKLCPRETADYLKNAAHESGIEKDDFCIYQLVGDNGVAYEAVDTMIKEMMGNDDIFKFSDSFENGNIIYTVAEGGTHSYEYCYKYIYNALPLFFK